MKRISRDHINYTFSKEVRPVLEIEPGEDVVFETLDAASGKIETTEDALTVFAPKEQANPASGPVAVKGAEIGDSLVVRIKEIDLAPYGYSRIRSGGGVIIEELDPPQAKIIQIEGETVHFTDRIKFPTRPMVGVIGVAPAGEAVHTFYPGPHGGNMDCNLIRESSKVYLPVSAPGALLSIGDVHASMGDGELTGGGIDIGAKVTVTVDLLKGRSWKRPWVETEDVWATCSNAPDLAEAIKIATSDMTTFLADKLEITREEAFILIGARGDIKVGQAAGLEMDVTTYLAVPKFKGERIK